MNYQYSDGTTNFGELPNEEILRRIAANPEGKHLVWREGMAEWKNAREMREFVHAYQPQISSAVSSTVLTETDIAPKANQTATDIPPASVPTGTIPAKSGKKNVLLPLGILGVIVVAVVLFFVFSKSTYEKGVDLVKEGNYEEAMSVFASVDPTDSDYQKCVVGGMVAEMGLLYEAEKYSEAREILYATEESNGILVYKLVVSPTDELYSDAATISTLVSSQLTISWINEFLNDDVSDDEFEWWLRDNPEGAITEALETAATEQNYYSVDTVDTDDPYDEPHIIHFRFDKIVASDFLLNEFKSVKEKLETLKPKVAAKTIEYYAYAEEQKREQERENAGWQASNRFYLYMIGTWWYDNPVLTDVREIYKFTPSQFCHASGRSGGGIIDQNCFHYMLCELVDTKTAIIIHHDERLEGREFLCNNASLRIRVQFISQDELSWNGITMKRLGDY